MSSTAAKTGTPDKKEAQVSYNKSPGEIDNENDTNELELIPSHPSLVLPLLQHAEIIGDSQKLMQKIKQDPEWKKRIQKMLSYEVHTIRTRMRWEENKAGEQKRSMTSISDMGKKKTEEQRQAIYSVKQTLKAEMTERLKLESMLAEEKRLTKKLNQELKTKAATSAPAKIPSSAKIQSTSKPSVSNLSSIIHHKPCPTPKESFISTGESKSILSPTRLEASELISFRSNLSTSPLKSLTSAPSKDSHKKHSSSRAEVVSNKSSSKMSIKSTTKSTYSCKEKDNVINQTCSSNIKLPKIYNSPLTSSSETMQQVPSIQSQPSQETSLIASESSVGSIYSKCSRCVEKSKKSPQAKSEKNTSLSKEEMSPKKSPTAGSPNYFFSQGASNQHCNPSYLHPHPPIYKQQHSPNVREHNLHISAHPLYVPTAAAPHYIQQPAYIQSPIHCCHQTQHHCQCMPTCHYNNYSNCNQCSPHKHPIQMDFGSEFQNLKDFIRAELLANLPNPSKRKNSQSRSSKNSRSISNYETSDTDSIIGQDTCSFASTANYKNPNNTKISMHQSTDESLYSKIKYGTNSESVSKVESNASIVLEDKLFMELVCDPIKYQGELQEIYKMLKSANITIDRKLYKYSKKLTFLTDLVRDAISYTESATEQSDTQDELYTSLAEAEVNSTIPRGQKSQQSCMTQDDISEFDLDNGDGNKNANSTMIEHVSSRAVHLSRKSKKTRSDSNKSISKTLFRKDSGTISPRTSNLKNTHDEINNPANSANLTNSKTMLGSNKVHFSTDTVASRHSDDNNEKQQYTSIPDDYVVLDKNEIMSVTKEMERAESLRRLQLFSSQTETSRTKEKSIDNREMMKKASSNNIRNTNSQDINISLSSLRSKKFKSNNKIDNYAGGDNDNNNDARTIDVAYSYQGYLTGDKSDPCIILQNQEDENISLSRSLSKTNRSHAASQLLDTQSRSNIIAEQPSRNSCSSKISCSHNLEMKASIHSIPLYVAESESDINSSVSLHENRSVANMGATSKTNIISHSSASLRRHEDQNEEDDLSREKLCSNHSIANNMTRENSYCASNENIKSSRYSLQTEKSRDSYHLKSNSIRNNSRESVTHSKKIVTPSQSTTSEASTSRRINSKSLRHSTEPTGFQGSSSEKNIERYKSSLVEKASKILHSFTTLVSSKSNKHVESQNSTKNSTSSTSINDRKLSKQSTSAAGSKNQFNTANSNNQFDSISNVSLERSTNMQNINTVNSITKTEQEHESADSISNENNVLTKTSFTNLNEQSSDTGVSEIVKDQSRDKVIESEIQNSDSKYEQQVQIMLSPQSSRQSELTPQSPESTEVTMTFGDRWEIICSKSSSKNEEKQTTVISNWREYHPLELDAELTTALAKIEGIDTLTNDYQDKTSEIALSLNEDSAEAIEETSGAYGEIVANTNATLDASSKIPIFEKDETNIISASVKIESDDIHTAESESSLTENDYVASPVVNPETLTGDNEPAASPTVVSESNPVENETAASPTVESKYSLVANEIAASPAVEAESNEVENEIAASPTVESKSNLVANETAVSPAVEAESNEIENKIAASPTVESKSNLVENEIAASLAVEAESNEVENETAASPTVESKSNLVDNEIAASPTVEAEFNPVENETPASPSVDSETLTGENEPAVSPVVDPETLTGGENEQAASPVVEPESNEVENETAASPAVEPESNEAENETAASPAVEHESNEVEIETAASPTVEAESNELKNETAASLTVKAESNELVNETAATPTVESKSNLVDNETAASPAVEAESNEVQNEAPASPTVEAESNPVENETAASPTVEAKSNPVENETAASPTVEAESNPVENETAASAAVESKSNLVENETIASPVAEPESNEVENETAASSTVEAEFIPVENEIAASPAVEPESNPVDNETAASPAAEAEFNPVDNETPASPAADSETLTGENEPAVSPVVDPETLTGGENEQAASPVVDHETLTRGENDPTVSPVVDPATLTGGENEPAVSLAVDPETFTGGENEPDASHAVDPETLKGGKNDPAVSPAVDPETFTAGENESAASPAVDPETFTGGENDQVVSPTVDAEILTGENEPAACHAVEPKTLTEENEPTSNVTLVLEEIGISDTTDASEEAEISIVTVKETEATSGVNTESNNISSTEKVESAITLATEEPTDIIAATDEIESVALLSNDRNKSGDIVPREAIISADDESFKDYMAEDANLTDTNEESRETKIGSTEESNSSHETETSATSDVTH